MTAISTIRNLGPKQEAAYRAAGIQSAEALHEMGPQAAYAALLATGHRPHFMAYMVLALGLKGRHFSDVSAEEKAELRAQYDALRQATPLAPDALSAELSAFLDRIGLPAR